MKTEDIKALAEIWLETSLKAHNFIPEKYWTENKSLMEEKYLPNSEVYVAEKANNIYGFIALIKNHVASIFVCNDQQGKGIGNLLLKHAKELHQELILNVYQKNEKSVSFYQSKDFKIVTEAVDQNTGEKEFLMQWKNETV